VLLFGGDGGHQNLGDQAMLINTVARLRRTLPGCEITALAAKPDRLAELEAVKRVRWPTGIFLPLRGPAPKLRVPGAWRLWRMQALWRGRQFVRAARVLRETGSLPPGTLPAAAELLTLMQEHDFALNYGCGGLNDIWTQAHVYVWCFCYQAAHALGKRVAVTGQGIGPLSHPLDRWLLCAALNEVDAITVRDCRDSAELLLRGGVRRSLVRIAADDAASLAHAPREAVLKALAEEGVPDTHPLVMVHFRDTTFDGEMGEEGSRVMAAVLDRLIEEAGAHICFVSMSYEPDGERVDDRLAAEKVRKLMRQPERATVLQRIYDPPTVKGIVAEADLAVGTSYHFLMFALTAARPTVGLYKGPYYRQKLRGLFGHFELENTIVDLEAGSPDPAVQAGLDALRNREALAERQSATTRRLNDELDAVWKEIQGWFASEPASAGQIAALVAKA
jgi:polysaccharide pyruvyl transferase WcaK-like protein